MKILVSYFIEKTMKISVCNYIVKQWKFQFIIPVCNYIVKQWNFQFVILLLYNENSSF